LNGSGAFILRARPEKHNSVGSGAEYVVRDA
jgi:hypothetical protein